MIRPLGSLPQSPYRARFGADTTAGFRALSVGSHHPVVTLDCVSPRGEAPLSTALFRRRSAARRIRRRASECAKTMRATLLASATAVSLNLYLTALRSSSEEAQRRNASLWPLRWLSVAQAPTTSSLRKYRSPILVMRPSRCLAAGRTLARRQAEKGGELSPVGKGADVSAPSRRSPRR